MGSVQRRSQQQVHQVANSGKGGCPTEPQRGDSCVGQPRLQHPSCRVEILHSAAQSAIIWNQQNVTFQGPKPTKPQPRPSRQHQDGAISKTTHPPTPPSKRAQRLPPQSDTAPPTWRHSPSRQVLPARLTLAGHLGTPCFTFHPSSIPTTGTWPPTSPKHRQPGKQRTNQLGCNPAVALLGRLGSTPGGGDQSKHADIHDPCSRATQTFGASKPPHVHPPARPRWP